MAEVSPESPARGAARWNLALLAASGAFFAAGLGFFLRGLLPPPAAAPAERPAAAEPPRPSEPGQARWKAVPAGSPLASARTVALAGGAWLSTDGEKAFFDPGDGQPRPLEVPAAITDVFAVGSRVFGGGQSEGAPFLVALQPGEEPAVIPSPCAASGLSGGGDFVAAVCADGENLALSGDLGRSFSFLAVVPPEPPAPEGAPVERSVEAIGARSDGSLAVALVQRWVVSRETADEAWAWGHVATREPKGGGLRFAPVAGLVRAVGLRPSGDGWLLAGLEASTSDEEIRPRLWSFGPGRALLPTGTAGPRCGTLPDAPLAAGVLLGLGEAAFLCGGRVALTLDGGETWVLDDEVEGGRDLFGGDLRLFVREAGGLRERQLPLRSAEGARAYRVASGRKTEARTGEALVPVSGIHEPDLDAGLEPDDSDAGAAPAGPEFH